MFVSLLVVISCISCSCGRSTTEPIAGDGGPRPDVRVDARTDGPLPDVPPPDVLFCQEGHLRCFGPTVEICLNGAYQDNEECQFGCASSPSPHCGDPVFTNGIVSDDFEHATVPLDPGPGVLVIDTDTGQITGPGAPAPGSFPFRVVTGSPGLPELAVLSFSSINVDQGATIRAVGLRALALLSSGSVLLNGTIDVGVQPDGSPGPGGYAGGASGGAGDGGGGGSGGLVGTLNFNEGGGGGAGFGGSGGIGGAGGQAQGGQGGIAYGNPQLDPIVGGSGGGSGAMGASSTPGMGGSGGGALILISLEQLEVGDSGRILAAGGGGRGGFTQEAGGGGGSGGAVRLTAPVVFIEGVVAANGGGGGGSDANPVQDGQDGQASATQALGGGQGGRGGAGAVIAGQQGGDGLHHGTGGGGSTGRIRLESALSPVLQGILSPAPGSSGFSQGPIQVE